MNKPGINLIIEKNLFPGKFKFRDFRKNVRTSVITVLEAESVSAGIINFKFCSDREIREVNKNFLGHDYDTDIITFKYNDNICADSDILISVETVFRNSLAYKNSFINEVYRVVIHGLLHFCGYEDYTRAQKQKMRLKENFYLNKLNSKGIL